jgi:hypothetical protein
VVVSATVAEPCATRSAVEMTKAWRSTGIPIPSSEVVSASPMPLM